jgi:hypothetical protein
MARRKARIPQGKKLQPAPLTMTFAIETPENYTATEQYIDLSQCASLINRRFYRQGLNWAVSGFSIGASVTTAGGATNPTGSITILKVPQTWIASNAWEKGMRTWQKMNNDALEEAESIRPKFLDFKVFMDSGHHTVGSAANLIPASENLLDPLLPAQGSFKLGEWDYSSYLIPDSSNPGAAQDREIIWTGGNYPGVGASGLNAVSLIEGYAASRGLPDIRDPNAPDDAADADGITPENWIAGIFNEGTVQDDRILDDMISENNLAPYPFENDGTHTDTQYPGGANNGGGLELHYTQPITSTTVGGMSSMPGGTFYGGLIKIKTSGDLTPGIHLLQLHLVPGPHRGYMCQPMQDV